MARRSSEEVELVVARRLGVAASAGPASWLGLGSGSASRRAAWRSPRAGSLEATACAAPPPGGSSGKTNTVRPPRRVHLRTAVNPGDPGRLPVSSFVAKLPRVAITCGSISSIWRSRYGQQASISSGCGSRLPGGRHLSDVGDEDVLALQPDLRQQLVEQLAGAADERQALAVLLGARAPRRRTSGRRRRCRRRRRPWSGLRAAGTGCTSRRRRRASTSRSRRRRNRPGPRLTGRLLPPRSLRPLLSPGLLEVGPWSVSCSSALRASCLRAVTRLLTSRERRRLRREHPHARRARRRWRQSIGLGARRRPAPPKRSPQDSQRNS